MARVFEEDGSSLSGHERNVLFLSREGRQFEDVSGVSGADDPADGRSLALLDYDRDGWQDLAIANANAPLFQLFRNQIGGLGAPRAGVLAVRFVGGNHGDEPAPGFTARDGFGAKLEVVLPDAVLVREHRGGEGFAAQNSTTMLVGLGSVTEARSLRIQWPSGRTQELGPVPEGSLVTVYEDASTAPRGEGYTVEPYRIEALASGAAERRAARGYEARHQLEVAAASANGQPLRLLSTMATWCETCKGELPQIELLRRTFEPKEVALIGIPVDEHETPSKLEAYVRTYAPAYELQIDLPEEQIEAVRRVVIEDLYTDKLPAAIATDAHGQVLRTMWDVPSISEVREILATLDR